MKYKIEYQQYEDGSHVCIATQNGDWVADCGKEGLLDSEDMARLIVKLLNKQQDH